MYLSPPLFSLENRKIKPNDLFIDLIAIKFQKDYQELSLVQKLKIMNYLFQQNMIENKTLNSLMKELEQSNLDGFDLKDYRFLL